MRDLMLYSGQEDNYKASQINRLCVHYGEELEAEMEEMEGEVVKSSQAFSAGVKPEEIVYGMFDGCMLPTRPVKIEGGEDIGSWKEMKLGRIFREQDHLELGDKPNVIRNSLYVSHFGKHDKFTDKLEPVLDVFEPLGNRLVFINDGATWIANFIKANYPKATDILDFFHSSEYLHDFSKVIYAKKTQTITYYKNNQHRMLYKTYQDKGLLIGSGPIESAHRFVLQKRMKQSGQKWTKSGGQAVANLRVVYINNQWDRVIKLINKAQKNVA